MNNIKKHNYNIDLIKVFASFSVICIHQISRIGFYTKPLISYEANFTMFLYPIFHTCVPLFFMCTGALLKKRVIDKKHYVGLIQFLIETILLILLGTVIMSIISSKNITIKLLLGNIINAPYYIGFYLILYLLIPFLNKFYFSLESKEEKKLLIVILFLVTSVPSLFTRFPNKLLPQILSQSYPVMYYFLGVYWSENQSRLSKTRILICSFCVCLIYLVSVKMVDGRVPFNMPFGYYENLFTALLSILVFSLFMNLKLESDTNKKIFAIISASTLGIYVLSSEYFGDYLANLIIPLTDNYKINFLLIFPTSIISMVVSLPISIFVNKLAKKVSNEILKML